MLAQNMVIYMCKTIMNVDQKQQTKHHSDIILLFQQLR